MPYDQTMTAKPAHQSLSQPKARHQARQPANTAAGKMGGRYMQAQPNCDPSQRPVQTKLRVIAVI